MNKLKTLAAAALIMLASCTSNEEDDSLSLQERTQISFAAPVMYGMTRAYAGPTFGTEHTVTVGEQLGAQYNINENLTVYGRRYQGTYQGWNASEQMFGELDNTGKGTAAGGSDYEEYSYLNTPGANGWFSKYPYYFFEGYKYSFSAVSPVKSAVQDNMNKNNFNESDFKCNHEGLSVIHYTSRTDYDEQAVTEEKRSTYNTHYDFMFSDRMYDIDRTTAIKKPSNGNNHYNGINVKLHHALSSVHFKICVSPEFVKQYNAMYGATSEYGADNLTDTNFKLHSIRIEGVRSTGDFSQNVTEPSSTSALTEANTKGSPAWTFQDASPDYAADKQYLYFTGGNDAAATPIYKNVHLPEATQTTIEKAATYIQNTVTAGSPYANKEGGRIFDDGVFGRYGLMIPQTFKGTGADSPDAKIVVEWSYTFVTGVNKKEMTQNFKNEIKLSDLHDAWLMGKRYVYTLVFDGKLLHFAPSVEDWAEETFNEHIN